MSTQGVGTFSINSKFASGSLVFYEKAVGRTATGDVFTVGTAAVKVGGTAQDVDFQWYGTGSKSFILDLGAASMTLVGLATATNGAVTITNATATSSTTTGALIVTGGIATAADLSVGDDIFIATGGVINFASGDATITHSTGVLAITPKLTVTGTGDYTSPAFSVTRTFVTADFDQTYHAAARVNLDLTNDVPGAKYASALNVRIIGASDVASTGQLYGLWVDSAGTAAAIGGTFYMARYSVQAGAAIPTAYMQFQTADPGVTYAFAFVNNNAIPPCTAGGTDCTASGATDPTYTIAVQTPNGNPGYIRVWAAA